MIVFIGWSADPQSTPIHLNFILIAHLWNSGPGPGCLTKYRTSSDSG